MGTSAVTVVYEDNAKLVAIYTQSDGYPESHGLELAEFLRGLTIVNGIRGGDHGRIANGMGCLAAQLVAALKTRVGGTYLIPTRNIYDHDYEYHIKEESVLVKEDNKRIFSGTWLEYQTWVRHQR